MLFNSLKPFNGYYVYISEEEKGLNRFGIGQQALAQSDPAY